MAMLQQNGQSPTRPPFPQNQHVFPSLPAGTSAPAAQDPTSFFNLDVSSSAAKQLAALNAAGIARRATQSGGTSGTFVGGMPPPSHNQLPNHHSPFRPASAASHPTVMSTDPSLHHNIQPMSNHPAQAFISPPAHDPAAFYRNSLPGVSQQMLPQHAASSFKQRQQQFLSSLAKMMEGRKTPLPPSITGISAQYDPTTSRWKNLEPASEVGGFKLAGKDIDLLKLWTTVLQSGGSAKLNQTNAWSSLLPHFGLPERLPNAPPEANASTAQVLASHFSALLGPSEELYLRNMEQRQALQHARLGHGQPLLPNGISGPLQPGIPASGGQQFGTPHTPQMRPGVGLSTIGSGMPPAGAAGMSMAGSLTDAVAQPITPGGEVDLDSDGRKRKLGDVDDMNSKRMRQKTDSEPPHTPAHGADGVVHSSNAAASTSSGQRNQPSRRKIEYVPLAREVDSAGGRDALLLQQEMFRLSRGRPLRDINEWGTVHVEALTMSLRSRLATELSYALATISILSTMRGGTPDSGFPISQCTDLLDEVLDLLEDLSFGGSPEMDGTTCFAEDPPIITNRELVNLAHTEGQTTFASLWPWQGEHNSELGPSQRPGDLIRILVNIIRNLSAIIDNQLFMGHHPTIVDLLLRLTSLKRTEHGPRPMSNALSLADLISIRKDVLGTLVNLAGSVSITSSSESQTPTASELHKARRIFELVASYLSDQTESISPHAWISRTGPGSSNRVPILIESALEVLTRFGQPDSNRRILVRAVPEKWIWTLFTALLHRLPITDQDFQLIMRDEGWLLYVERAVMALYSLGFQMPPATKQRVKADRSLRFTSLLMRLVKKFITQSPAEYRQTFVVCARRAVETMKVIDDCNDSFDASQPNVPPLTFGMGYGEVGDDSAEKGTGALGGHREDLLWGVMMQRELDDVMFAELESLTRVECA